MGSADSIIRATMPHLSDIVFILSPQGRIELISPTVRQVYGYAPEEVIGQAFQRFVEPDDLPAVQSSFARVLRGRTESVEFSLIDAAGDVRRVRHTSRPLPNANGPSGLVGSLTEISADESGAALSPQHAAPNCTTTPRGEHVFSFRVDTDTHLVPEWTSRSGDHSAGPTPGFPADVHEMLRRVHPADREAVRGYLESVVLAQPAPIEFRYSPRTGETRWLRVTCQAICDEAEARAVRLLGVARDITAQRHAETEPDAGGRRFREWADDAQPGHFRVDRTGRVQDVNAAWLGMHGDATRDEVIGRQLSASLEGSSDEEETARLIETVVSGAARGASCVTPPGGDSAPVGAEGSAIDVAAPQRSGDAAGRRTAYLAAIAEAAHDTMFIIDAADRVAYINPAGAALFDATPEELIGSSRAALFAPDATAHQSRSLEFIWRTGRVHRSQDHFSFPEKALWLDTLLVPLKDNAGHTEAILGISRNVTERIRQGQKTLHLKNFYEVVLENVKDGVLVTDRDGIVRYANGAFGALFAMPAHAIDNRNIWASFARGDARRLSSQYRTARDRLQPVPYGPIPVALHGGDCKYCTGWFIPRVDESGAFDGMICTAQDVTAAETAKQREQDLFRSMEFLSDNALDLMRLPAEEDIYRHVAQRLWELVHDAVIVVLSSDAASPHLTVEAIQCSEEQAAIIREVLGKYPIGMTTSAAALALDQVALGTLYRPAGDLFAIAGGGIPRELCRQLEERLHIAQTYALGLPAGERLSGGIVIMLPEGTSIASRETIELFAVQTSAALQRWRVERENRLALREKEVLVKEIHHRTKNNLQLVSSLLYLQSNFVSDPQALAVLQDSQRRIRSMATIHERLYHSADLSRINFGEYVSDLSNDLTYAYRTSDVPIALRVDAGGVFLSVQDAIPCGLIIGELASNAMKHAFPPGRASGGDNRIHISMHKAGRRVTLCVSDSGVGLPPAIDHRKTDTLGLQLVNLLVEQLSGTITLSNEGGATFTIVFQESGS